MAEAEAATPAAHTSVQHLDLADRKALYKALEALADFTSQNNTDAAEGHSLVPSRDGPACSFGGRGGGWVSPVQLGTSVCEQ